MHDCDKIDAEAKEYVDNKIYNSNVYLIGLSYCGWCTKAKQYLKRMGEFTMTMVKRKVPVLSSSISNAEFFVESRKLLIFPLLTRFRKVLMFPFLIRFQGR